ncbi:hypothetical protein INS90_05825 [Trueperella pecoris]|uniref:Uncharacterized protein n=1 Tax=Trueperella pecoris TaxID=2733571 RepID=A0A7M1QXQ3_9ACTO|nr:hypothetical protein [Trueperella pecoris]QOR46820.1 hypothetical protein INS90_05825 [Trueperella pecoris]
MSLGPGSMNLFLPAIERLSRLPGKALVSLAGVGNALLLVVGWQAGYHSSSAAWIPFGAGVFFSLVLVFFSLRRRRLEQGVDRYTELLRQRYQAPTGVAELSMHGGDGVVIDENGEVIAGPNPRGMRVEAERLVARERLADAEREASLKKNVFLPRLEAAQRAAIAQAGGLAEAPHLRDDLRWTLVSAAITLASLPLIGFLVIVSLFIWL